MTNKQLEDMNFEEAALAVMSEMGEDSMQFCKTFMKYIMFDLEATRRERDKLRMILEDKD